MTDIRSSLVALDTNQFLFAIRRDADYPSCETLLFDRLHRLDLYVPGEVLAELRRNLSEFEIRGIFEVLRRAKSIVVDYEPAAANDIERWQNHGAKKGDAVIAAMLDRAGVEYFVSETRHFLREIAGLPFQVINSEQAIRELDATE